MPVSRNGAHAGAPPQRGQNGPQGQWRRGRTGWLAVVCIARTVKPGRRRRTTVCRRAAAVCRQGSLEVAAQRRRQCRRRTVTLALGRLGHAEACGSQLLRVSQSLASEATAWRCGRFRAATRSRWWDSGTPVLQGRPPSAAAASRPVPRRRVPPVDAAPWARRGVRPHEAQLGSDMQRLALAGPARRWRGSGPAPAWCPAGAAGQHKSPNLLRPCPAPGSGCHAWPQSRGARPAAPHSRRPGQCAGHARRLQLRVPSRPTRIWKCAWLWLPWEAP